MGAISYFCRSGVKVYFCQEKGLNLRYMTSYDAETLSETFGSSSMLVKKKLVYIQKPKSFRGFF
jgi:hypothetical protein